MIKQPCNQTRESRNTMSHSNPVYLVALLSIHDRERYARYEVDFIEVFQNFGGSLLSVDDNPTAIEGEWPWSRTVLLQFPNAQEASAWYNSESYQEIAQHRFAASIGQIAQLNALPAQ